MTSQQMTMALMAATGFVLFIGGRYLARKLVSTEPRFLPAGLLTLRGLGAYVSTVASWAGAALTVVCLLLLFS